jgi:hypothetical protein
MKKLKPKKKVLVPGQPVKGLIWERYQHGNRDVYRLWHPLGSASITVHKHSPIVGKHEYMIAYPDHLNETGVFVGNDYDYQVFKLKQAVRARYKRLVARRE